MFYDTESEQVRSAKQGSTTQYKQTSVTIIGTQEFLLCIYYNYINKTYQLIYIYR